jgi:hypothetical protein
MTDTETKMEKPCEDTGKGCRWIWCCDRCNNMFCRDCYRDRDWDLKEYGDEEG